MAKKSSMRVGGGGRFKKLERSLEKRGKSKGSARAIAASIGRKKYGKRKMGRMAAAGRRRHSR